VSPVKVRDLSCEQNAPTWLRAPLILRRCRWHYERWEVLCIAPVNHRSSQYDCSEPNRNQLCQEPHGPISDDAFPRHGRTTKILRSLYQNGISNELRAVASVNLGFVSLRLGHIRPGIEERAPPWRDHLNGHKYSTDSSSPSRGQSARSVLPALAWRACNRSALLKRNSRSGVRLRPAHSSTWGTASCSDAVSDGWARTSTASDAE